MDLSPVTAVVSLVSAAAGAGGMWTVLRHRVSEHDRQFDELEARLDSLEKHREDHALSIQRMGQDLDYTRKAVERIERLLEQLISRGSP